MEAGRYVLVGVKYRDGISEQNTDRMIGSRTKTSNAGTNLQQEIPSRRSYQRRPILPPRYRGICICQTLALCRQELILVEEGNLCCGSDV